MLMLGAVPDRAARLQRQFGVTLRAERQARKLTQQDLAFAAGLSLTYVGEVERGQRMVSLDTVQRLTQRKFPVIEAPRRPGDAASVVADARRARELLGWQPHYDDLDTIISHALSWESSPRFQQVITSND